MPPIITFRKEKLNELVAYVIPFTILLAVTKLILFYKAFGFTIVSFLTFGELLTSFLDDIVYVLAFFGRGFIRLNGQVDTFKQGLTSKQRFIRFLKENTFIFIVAIVYTILLIRQGKFRGLFALMAVGGAFLSIAYYMVEEAIY